MEGVLSELATRDAGKKALAELDKLLATSDVVEIDFSGKSITPSFADECLGTLASRIGLVEFKRRIRMINVPEPSRPLIKHVVSTRCLRVA